MSSRSRSLILLAGLLVLTGAVMYGLQRRIANVPSAITLLDPAEGLYRTARTAVPPSDSSTLRLPTLHEPVVVVRDERHVPHIYAESDRDATIALGYVVAQDRLFQMDFIPRVASGRLSEAFGAQSVRADQFLRQTGMEWGAQKNLERIREADGVELDALQWYGEGVNAFLDQQARGDLPLEFRLLGYRPDRYAPIQGLRLIQYMNYDLTYNSDDPVYTRLRRKLGNAAYETLYPQHPAGLFEPIIPPEQQLRATASSSSAPERPLYGDADAALQNRRSGKAAVRSLLGPQDVPGKGSNNWAVHENRSATEAPILAGDMHLSLTLPSIWYEAHLVTPSMNAYGLTIPGAPVLIQAFNRHVGWTMTNTGADQIDHLVLTLDSSRTRYRYEGEWRDLRRMVDTIRVKNSAPVLDTTYFSHHGPVHFSGEGTKGTAIAERWTAHDPSSTLRALWKMNRADSVAAVTTALRDWDTPMQNILYTGTEGDIAIRSAGDLPMRRAGEGRGLLPGSTDAYEWTGRVPFDSLPAARNPEQEFLASANQKPTGSDYPYYLGHDWNDGYRSLRIDALLRSNASHTVADLKRYQGDVRIPQHQILMPYFSDLEGLSPRADTLQALLQRWNGESTVDRPEPLIFDELVSILHEQMWDESVFTGAPNPEDAVLMEMLRTNPGARWFDVQATNTVEDASALLTRVLEATADTMATKYGWTPSAWRWGEHHQAEFRHLSGSEMLRPLWRGPHEFPGFATTVLQAPGNPVTHSASQRVVVDFSTTPPTGHGVVPGGQSGRPLDPNFYDTQISAYLNFEYFRLKTPESPSDWSDEEVRSMLRIEPSDSSSKR